MKQDGNSPTGSNFPNSRNSGSTTEDMASPQSGTNTAQADELVSAGAPATPGMQQEFYFPPCYSYFSPYDLSGKFQTIEQVMHAQMLFLEGTRGVFMIDYNKLIDITYDHNGSLKIRGIAELKEVAGTLIWTTPYNKIYDHNAPGLCFHDVLFSLKQRKVCMGIFHCGPTPQSLI